MTPENWLTVLSIFVSGFVGYLMKYWLDKKAQFSSQNAEIKRVMYQEYIDFIMQYLDYLGDKEKQKDKHMQKRFNEKNAVAFMKKFYKESILYASPKVIAAYSDYMQHSYKDTQTIESGLYTMVLMTNVFKAMRNDIGLSNRGLGSGGIRLMRPQINDYDTVIRPKELNLLIAAKNVKKENKS